VSLRENKSIEISIDKSAKFFGKADFGSFQIEGKDLKSIHFQKLTRELRKRVGRGKPVMPREKKYREKNAQRAGSGDLHHG